MTALEEYNSDPPNPLPEYTGELPQGQFGVIDTVQLSDDGSLASVQDPDTGLLGYIDKTGGWPPFGLAKFITYYVQQSKGTSNPYTL